MLILEVKIHWNKKFYFANYLAEKGNRWMDNSSQALPLENISPYFVIIGLCDSPILNMIGSILV